MCALVFLLEVELPVGVKVAVHDCGAQQEYGFRRIPPQETSTFISQVTQKERTQLSRAFSSITWYKEHMLRLWLSAF